MTNPAFDEPSIVVVDDNADDLLLTCCLLRKAGLLHAVRTFDCSLAALRHLEAEFARCRDTVGATTPIVIVDGHMPELDGFGLLEALRALPGGGEGTLIMLSGSQDPEDRVRALGCGADEYLLKFPDAETLRRAVEKSRSVHAG